MKLCGSCKRDIPITQYATTRRSPDGYNNYCKECQREVSRRNRIKKYGYKDTTIVRRSYPIMHVSHQIDHVVELVMAVDFRGTVFGFHLTTKEQYRFHITFSADGMIIEMTSLKDQTTKSFTHNGYLDYRAVLVNFFKMLYIRPESSYLEMCEVLTTIYW